jgi:hypothetical protein
MDIASPTADPKTSDNHNKTGANAPTSQFPFPASLQRAGTGTGKCMRSAAISAARATAQIAIHHILWFGAFSRPGRSISMPSRAAAVKTGPVQGRRRLGLDGREHDGTMARHGHGRSPLRSMTLNQRAR